MSKEFKSILGKTGRDKVTGFEGTITGVAVYLTGCNQYLLRPKTKEDGSMIEGHWFDDMRVEVSGKTIKLEDGKKKTKPPKNGADQAAPIK